MKLLVVLIKKDYLFLWLEACQAIFKEMKYLVISALVLRYYERSCSIVLETDSLDYVNSGVLL